jgi:hypothetical protein
MQRQWEDEEMLAAGVERLASVIRRMQGEEGAMDDYDIKMRVAEEPKDFW